MEAESLEGDPVGEGASDVDPTSKEFEVLGGLVMLMGDEDEEKGLRG